jgi:hypothetical protein
MLADVIKLRDEVCKWQFPVEAIDFVTLMLDQTHQHYLGIAPSGEDYLAALVGKPAHWLVPIGIALSWKGGPTDHFVIDAEGCLTGELARVRDDLMCCAEDPSNYVEVLVGICDDGSVVMYSDSDESPSGVWRAYWFAMQRQHRDALVAKSRQAATGADDAEQA